MGIGSAHHHAQVFSPALPLPRLTNSACDASVDDCSGSDPQALDGATGLDLALRLWRAHWVATVCLVCVVVTVTDGPVLDGVEIETDGPVLDRVVSVLGLC